MGNIFGPRQKQVPKHTTISTSNKTRLFTIQRVSNDGHLKHHPIPTCSFLFPVKSTWLAAIERGAFATWPYITYHAVQKHLNPSPITSKGHIKQTPTKLRSTRQKPSEKPITSTSPLPSDNPTIKSLLQATINLANKVERPKGIPFPLQTPQPSHEDILDE